MKQRTHIILISTVVGAGLLVLLSIYLFFVSFSVDIIKKYGIGDIKQLEHEISISPFPVNYQQIVQRYASEKDIHIIIVDMDANLLADSRYPGPLSGQYINANLSAAKEGRVVSSIVRDQKNKSMKISVGKVVDVGAMVKGADDGEEVIISCIYSLLSFPRLANVYIFLVVVIIILISLLVALLTKYSLRQYRKPLSKLLQHTKKAAESPGGFNKISIDSTNPELLQLVKEFNSLIDSYDLLIASDNAKYSKINSLLSHIRTGIMIVDPENRVSLINPRAEELLDVDKALLFSRRSGEIAENPMMQLLLGLTKKVNEDKETRTEAVTTKKGVILDLNIEAMYSKYRPYEHSGSLVLIRDITEIERLERLKEEFVSNVSHELRTPLTVINGFVQTLQSWDVLTADDRMKSLAIIELETERLKKLISELLVLSRIEGEMDVSNSEVFDPVRVLAEAVKSLIPVALKKSITLEFKFNEDAEYRLKGRKIWFKQIAVNLIENAVKYSSEHTAVQIDLNYSSDHGDDGRGGGQIKLVVADQGIGIPSEDIPRIFERFFRVEKSRNSRIAGSGLGLAITKLMIEEFKGDISVASEIGVGTTITVLLNTSGRNKRELYE